jgi:hypothetical protein
MLEAEKNKEKIMGVKGFAPLGCSPFFDLVWSYNLDHMHSFSIGLTKDLILKYLQIVDCVIPGLNFATYVNEQLKKMKSIREMTRAPQNSLITDCSNWKANQLKDFLLCIGPIILKGILKDEYYKNFMNFSQAIFIFDKEVITYTEFYIASKKVYEFLQEFEKLFGEGAMKYNVHLLSHLPTCVLKLGPIHTYSLFGYESKNNFVNKFVAGTYNVVQEASQKFLLRQSKFLGQNLNTTKSFKVYKKLGEILITAKPRIPQLTESQKHCLISSEMPLSSTEVKNFRLNGVYFSINQNKNTKCDDSYILTKDGMVGFIQKILISQENVYIFFYECLKLTHSNIQAFTVVSIPSPKIHIMNALNIYKKNLYFNEHFMFTYFPNHFESN